MPPPRIPAPEPDEYPDIYAEYVERALEAPGLEDHLSRQPARLAALLGALPDDRAAVHTAPGAWSVKEVVGHILDGERFFAHRLLCISRGDPAPLPGFDQDAYVAAAGFDDHPLAGLLDEFEQLRAANLLAIGRLGEAALGRRGLANGAPVSARALVHILAGHVDHHLQSLERDLGADPA